MAKLDLDFGNVETIEAIDKKLEENQEDGFREYIGASMLGSICERALWYSFRWHKKSSFNGRMLRLFRRGHAEEQFFIDDLRSIGIEVRDLDEKGEQFKHFILNGHIGGHTDGFVKGILEDDQKWFVIDYKTGKNSKFREFVRKKVRGANSRYYAQLQLYMRWFGYTSSLFFIVNKDNDERYLERVDYNEDEAKAFEEKAERIIRSSYPLKKISKYPDYFICKMCDYVDICHGEEEPEKNCRTCKFSSPVLDEGTQPNWRCSKKKIGLTKEKQLLGCDGREEIKKDL